MTFLIIYLYLAAVTAAVLGLAVLGVRQANQAPETPTAPPAVEQKKAA